MAQRVWHIISQTVTRWTSNDGNLLAAAMAYYAALSFFPLLLVTISGLGLALQFSSNAQNAKQQLLELISQNGAQALADEVSSILAEVQMRAAFGGPVGLATLLLGAIGIFSQLESAFARFWHDPTQQTHGIWHAIRNALWNRLVAFLTLIGLGLGVLAAFIAGLTLRAFHAWAPEVLGGNSTWQSVQLVASITLNAFVFTILYKMVPPAFVRFSHAACGGVAVAVTWALGSQLVSRIVVGGKYTAYGVVGSFIAMMLWVYCASILIFLGAQMVQVLGQPDDQRPTNPPK